MVMVLQYIQIGDALAFLSAQQEYGLNRALTIPFSSIFFDLNHFLQSPIGFKENIDFQLFIDDIFSVGGLVFSIIIFKRYGPQFGLLVFFLMLFPLCSGRTIGMLRYMLPAFPIYMLLAELCLKNKRFNDVWLIISCALTTFFTICFSNWYWAG